jgi:hypothetical protein
VATPQDWAPYTSVEDAAKVYLRDPTVAIDQLRGVVDFRTVDAFVMSRGINEESWGEALWQEVVLTDSRRLILWRGTDEMSAEQDREPRRTLDASVRTILLSSLTDQILSEEFEVLDDGTRRLSAVYLRLYTQLLTRSFQKSVTDTNFYCESFRYSKSVENGGLAQMERLIQFGRVLSRAMRLGKGEGS